MYRNEDYYIELSKANQVYKKIESVFNSCENITQLINAINWINKLSTYNKTVKSWRDVFLNLYHAQKVLEFQVNSTEKELKLKEKIFLNGLMGETNIIFVAKRIYEVEKNSFMEIVINQQSKFGLLNNTVVILTTQPGLFIGKGGKDIDNFKTELEKFFKFKIDIKIIEL